MDKLVSLILVCILLLLLTVNNLVRGGGKSSIDKCQMVIWMAMENVLAFRKVSIFCVPF